jgi:hypothetical protein
MDERPVYKSFSRRLQEARRSVSGYSVSNEYQGTALLRLATAVETIQSRINSLQLSGQDYSYLNQHIGDTGMTEEMQKYDLNGDGVIDEAERRIMLEDRRRRMEDEDAQRDSIRKMAWFALFGMLLYPSGIFLCDLFGLNTAASILGDISPTYFVAVSALVASFFGASAYQSKKKSD